MPLLPLGSLFVTDLPGLPPIEAGREFVVQSGYLPARTAYGPKAAPKDNAYLYFMLHRAMYKPRRRKLIVWLNGGPGCSSFDGSMMEIGPWRFQGGNLSWTPPGGAWNEYADVLYGFSSVDQGAYAKSLAEVGEDFAFFLAQFVEVYPEYAKDRHHGANPAGAVDVYLAGESYAGQYIPYIAHAIQQKRLLAPVQLAGMAIGNGDIDPASQAGSEVDMMLASHRWEKNGAEHKAVKPLLAQCQAALKKDTKPKSSYPACEAVLSSILETSTRDVDGTAMCLNAYDMRLQDTSPACGMNWPEELAPTYTYLRRPDVLKALHVDTTRKPEAWVECNASVGRAIRTHAGDSDASVTLLPALLEAGVPLLLYAGDQDLICNHLGLEKMIAALQWNGTKGIGSAPVHAWRINGMDVGTWQSARNLTYVQVANASHMVGHEQPFAAHDMMLRFMDVDMNLGSGVAALNTSTVGLDARVLVPDRGPTLVPGRAPPPQAAVETPAAVPPQAAPPVLRHTDWVGNLFVIGLIVAAVAACLFVRRRARTRSGPYHAVGQHVLGSDAHPGRVPRRSPALAPTDPIALEPFTLGDADEAPTP